MLKWKWFVLLLTLTSLSYAQSHSISGSIKDSTTKHRLTLLPMEIDSFLAYKQEGECTLIIPLYR